MPLINSEEHIGQARPSVWWPQFDNLYEALREACMSDAPSALLNLEAALAKSQAWLAHSLLGFQPPSPAAKAQLEKQEDIQTPDNKRMPITAVLSKAALQLSTYLGLNELQAYILVKRWSSSQADIPAELSSNQLQELQTAYFLQRSYLLRSIEELLTSFGPKQYAQCINTAVHQALASGLEQNLSQALSQNLAKPVPDSFSHRQHMSASVQQCISEREDLMSLLLCLYSMWTSCQPDTFRQTMQSLHEHVFHALQPAELVSKTAYLAQYLSVQLLQLPSLLYALTQDEGLVAAPPMLLGTIDGQAAASHVFKGWQEASPQQSMDSGISAAHGPALLAFAAAVSLLQSLPDASGAFSDVDCTAFASLAGQLGVLPQLALLSKQTWPGAVADCVTQTLLNLICAVIAAFDLSPFTLPAAQLHAVVELMANLYEGKPDLCQAFHDPGHADHQRHAPLRHFYRQALQLGYEDPTPILQLWHALASGPQAQDYVAGMIENPLSPTTRHCNHDRLHQLSENSVQATQALAVSLVEECTVPEATVGHVLPLPQYLLDQEGTHQDATSSFLVLWQSEAGQSDWQPLETNTVLLMRAQRCWRHIRQDLLTHQSSEVLAAEPGYLELLLILKLFAKLTDSCAVNGQDLLRVHLGRQQMQNTSEADTSMDDVNGSDALDLGCQIMDVISQAAEPLLELLGVSLRLVANLAEAFPGHIAKSVSCSYLLGVSHDGASWAGLQLKGLQHVQRMLEGRAGQYPVTLAFLKLTNVLVTAGINHACVKAYVGYTLSHILSSCHAWRYSQRRQRWQIANAALQVLTSALASPLAAAGRQLSGVPDWSLATAVAEAMGRPGSTAGYLLPNLPHHADTLNKLIQRDGREHEACALESLAETWLELIPLLVQACLSLPLSPAFLHDLFQSPEGGKQSAANSLASYVGLPFADPLSLTLALEGAAALVLACSGPHTGPLSLARCLLGGSTGDTANDRALNAIAASFYKDQATADPLRFAAATQILIAALQGPHPSLLAVLLDSRLAEQNNDKENSSQSANMNTGALVAAPAEGQSQAAAASKPNKKQAAKCNARPTCLDGLWQILKCAEELRNQQPQVLALAVQALATMWQAGQVAAIPMSTLRDQPDFLKHIAACISHQQSVDGSAQSENSDNLLQRWDDKEELAWRMMAEANAFDILAVEAFLQARAKSGEHQPAIWQLLDRWGLEGSPWGGPPLSALQHYSECSWRIPSGVEGGLGGQDMGQALIQELHWEAEAKLMNILTFITTLDGSDLNKHIAGYSCISNFWAAVKPVMAAHHHTSAEQLSEQGKTSFLQACNEAFLDLAERLASRETNSHSWKQLTQEACRSRAHGSDSDEEDRSFEARQALLLYDIRQLGLTEQLLHLSLALHNSTTPRGFEEGILLDIQWLEDSVGSLIMARAAVRSLQTTLFRSVNVLAALQDAHQQAVTSLRTLITVMSRSSALAQPPLLPTPTASELLSCLQHALTSISQHSAAQRPQSAPIHIQGLDLQGEDLQAALNIAQMVLSQLRHWKPSQQSSEGAKSPALPPASFRHRPSRLHKSSSGAEDCGGSQAAISTQLMQLIRAWLKYTNSPPAEARDFATSEALTQCVLTALLLVLRNSNIDASTSRQYSQRMQAAQALLPYVCQLVASLGSLASSAAMVTGVMLRACHMEPADWILAVTQHLHIVQAMAQAYHRRSTTVLQKQQQQQQQQQQQTLHQQSLHPHEQPNLSLASASQQAGNQQPTSTESSSAEREGTVEGALLTLAQHFAQSTAGAHMLLDQGMADLLPQLAKWLLSPAGGDLSNTQHQQPSLLGSHQPPDTSRAESQVDLGGAYTPEGLPTPSHQQWCALLSLTGVLVRSVSKDDRLDRAVVSLLAVAQDRMLMVVTPPEATPQQPLTLALLEEVEKVLFLVTCLPHLRGRWQMAGQTGTPTDMGGGLRGPLGMRQACCVFLDFAALAVQHQQQPCCPPVSPHEKLLARLRPHLPVSQAWFRATAVGSDTSKSPQLPTDDSHDQHAVAASDYSCQVAESMYSCMVLALHMLATFCPEVGLQEAQAGLGLGWPHTATLCSLQKQCHALSHCQLPLSSRGKALARNLKGCLLLTTHLPNQMHVPLSERQAKDVTSSGHKLQMFLSKS